MQAFSKRFLGFCVALLSFLPGLYATPAASVDSVSVPRLSLDECLRIALSDNPTIKIASMEVKRMDYSRREVLGQLLPDINFSGSYSRMLAKQVMYMNLSNFGGFGGGGDSDDESATTQNSRAGGDTGMKVGLDNSWSLGFSASMPLVAPQLWKSISISDTRIAQSLEQARSSKLSMVNEVKNAYYGYMLALASRKVIGESYDMAALTHDIYVKQNAAGAASDFDVLRTSVAMKNIEPEILQADLAIRQGRLRLLVLMGLDGDFNFLPDSELALYEEFVQLRGAAVDTCLNSSPQLRLNALDIELQRNNVSAQRLAYAPTLALSANYNWTSSSDGSPFRNFRWNPYSMIGVSLQMPIFSGGQRYSRLKQAQVQLIELELQRQDLRRSLSMQASIAADNIRLNLEQMRSSSQSVAQAVRAHEIMSASFDLGAASYLDLRDSELALTRSRLAFLQAIYNSLVAHADLELLLGNAPIDSYTTPLESK